MFKRGLLALWLALIPVLALAQNVELGGAGGSITTGVGNVLVGTPGTGGDVASADHSTIVGGGNAGGAQDVNSNATVFGYAAAENNTAGGILAIGPWALHQNTVGWQNLAIGIEAAEENVTGSRLTIVGPGALRNNTGGHNHTAVGHDALKGVVTTDNGTAVGKNSQFENTGGQNTTIGAFSMGGTATAGSRNTFAGAYAGSLMNGHGSVGVGYEAGTHAGDYSVYLGHQAGKGSDRDNALWIANTSGTPLIFGDFSTGAIEIDGGSGTVTASAFNVPSDRRLKDRIRPLDAGNVVARLNPVRFAWRAGGREDIGFIAQEVREVVPEAVSMNGEYLQLDAIRLLPHLVAELQTLRRRVCELEEAANDNAELAEAC